MLSLVFVLAELRETRGLELEMTQALPAHSGFLHDGPPKTRRLFCPTSQARRAKIFVANRAAGMRMHVIARSDLSAEARRAKAGATKQSISQLVLAWIASLRSQ